MELTRGLPQKDFLGEIVALTTFVRDEIRYVRDVKFCETVHQPTLVLEYGQGDCDDKSVLLASLLMSIGYMCRFVVVDQGRGWCHVWVQVDYGGKWIDLETTEPVDVGNPSVYLKKSDRIMTYPIFPPKGE